ncbi:hypothetical protein DTO169C6_8726 [Paecilomyces variotii]|nr:hypothetical protein DTO169C6_8726 [Paecilomyces variotii]
MKVVTANFISCAVKSCKISPAAFPLHFQDAELEQQELDLQPEFIRNILPRIDWDALRITASELGFPTIPETKPEGEALDEQTLKDLHTLLLETRVVEGKLFEFLLQLEFGAGVFLGVSISMKSRSADAWFRRRRDVEKGSEIWA